MAPRKPGSYQTTLRQAIHWALKNRGNLSKTFRAWRGTTKRSITARPPRARAKTKTKEKYNYKSKEYKNPVAQGYGKTNHTYTKRVKDPSIPKLYKQMSSLTMYNSIDTGAGISAVGDQGVAMIGTWYAGRSGLTTPGDSAMLLTDQFNDAQRYVATGNQYHTGNLWIAGSGAQSHKLFLKRFTHELTITNQSPIDAKVKIRYLFSKVSAADSDNPITTWTNAIAAETNNSVSSIAQPGANPSETKGFNLRWKCFHEQNLMMPAGYTHEHTETINFNRIIDMMHCDTFNVIRGITITCMIQWYGQPVDDGGTAKVTFAPVKLIWISNYKASCRFIVHSNKSIRQVDNQETGLTALKFMDTDEGKVGDLLSTDPNA